MQLKIFETENEVLTSLAEYFIGLVNESISKQLRFSIALSGGNSPKKLYALLASGHFKNKVDWSKIDFFFGDERYVSHTDNSSNYKMANEVLLQPLNIAPEQVFPIETTLSPDAAAEDYFYKIRKYFKGQVPRFDLVLLGLGDNSHTASLFPNTPVLNETAANVKPVFLADQHTYRISFTAPLINLAKNIAFLVYGEGKKTAVYNVLEGQKDLQEFPAQIIQPHAGDLVWFLDKAAATRLTTRF